MMNFETFTNLFSAEFETHGYDLFGESILEYFEECEKCGTLFKGTTETTRNFLKIFWKLGHTVEFTYNFLTKNCTDDWKIKIT